MEQAHLKKEFTDSSELQRMRNIITKKYGNSTKIQKGYEKEFIERKEGEIWEENGKKWTVKNGLTSSYTPTQLLRDELKIPLWCPSCGGKIKTNYDKKMFKIYSHCFDCQLKSETKMKIEGNFQEFEDKIIKENIIQMVRDVEDDMKEFMNGEEEVLILTSNGDTEEWSGEVDKNNVIKDVKEMTEKFKEVFDIDGK
jgi:hypothetical protein